MKRIISFFLSIYFITNASAQSVGIGINTPHPSSLLEINSTSKGLLLPRVDDTSSISDPAKGLTIYSNADNKIWFRNAGRWQQAMSHSGGMDSLWYKTKDSIANSGKKYVGINTDPAFSALQANLQVSGNLLVQEPQQYTLANPTAAQTYQMDNTGNYTKTNAFDSVYRILDPGGTANYINNTQGNIIVFSETKRFGHEGLKIKFNALDFGIAAGDTLWISEQRYPACRDNYALRLDDRSVIPGEMVVTAKDYYFSFRSDNAVTAKGFDITITRLYVTNSQKSKPINASGSAFYFSDGSLAAGYSSNAKGLQSVALGSFANANAEGAMAIGNEVTANGSRSLALGDRSTATGNSSLAFGNGTVSSGYGAMAMGNNTSAQGNYSFATGISTIAKSYGTVSIGSFNDTSDIPNQSSLGATDRVFQVGNGFFPFRRSNALTVLRNGNVGIGTVTPRAPLQFPNTIANRKIVLWETINTEFDYFGFGINDYVLRYNVPAGNYHVFFGGTKALFSIHSDGNANLAGTLSQNSDARLKTNITPIHYSLKALKSLNGYSYYWKDSYKNNEQQIGLLAQEVQCLFPQLVHTDNKGMLSVNYTGLIPVIVEAIKELNDKLEAQQQQIDELLGLIKNNR